MTTWRNGWIVDESVTFGSVEHRSKADSGWVFICYGEAGFCTMAKRERRA